MEEFEDFAPKVNEEDLTLFNKLDAASRSLSLSVLDPLAIPNPNLNLDGIAILKNTNANVDFSRVYFYCEDDGDDIVKKRIEEHEKELKSLYVIHKNMHRLFKNLDRCAKNKDRKGIYDLTS